MRSTGSFKSAYPKCQRERRQEWYSRATLSHLLAAGDIIEAYCFTCEERWPIGISERAGLAAEFAHPAASAQRRPLNLGGQPHG
jgi:hypothetical protein